MIFIYGAKKTSFFLFIPQVQLKSGINSMDCMEGNDLEKKKLGRDVNGSRLSLFSHIITNVASY